jgi:hypothetical protein
MLNENRVPVTVLTGFLPGFAIAVAATACLLGWAANAAGFTGSIALHAVAERSHGVLAWLCTAVLGLGLVDMLYRRGMRGVLENLFNMEHAEHVHHHPGCCGQHDHAHGSEDCRCAQPSHGQREAHGRSEIRANSMRQYSHVEARRLVLRDPPPRPRPPG